MEIKLEIKLRSFKQAVENMEKKEAIAYAACLPVSRDETLKEHWIENFVEVRELA
jgi:hypothetical protein